MNAMANEFDLAQATMLPPMPGAPREAPDAAVLSEQWAAVHEAAGAVGGLAQLGRETLGEDIADLPERAAQRGGWHFEAAARGIDRLALDHSLDQFVPPARRKRARRSVDAGGPQRADRPAIRRYAPW